MSFLDRLVARSLGTPAALQPRTFSPFEALSPRTLQEPLEPMEVEASYEGQAPSQAAPSPLMVVPVFAPSTPEQSPARTLTPSVGPPLLAQPAPLRSPAMQPPLSAGETFPRRPEPEPAPPSPRMDALSPRSELPPEPGRPRPQAEPRIPLGTRPSEPRPPVEVRRERHERHDRIVPAAPAAAGAPAAPKASVPTGLQPLPSAQPRRLPAVPPAAPDVHIHIGRIEVRATRPEAAPSPSRAPEAAGPSDLERYLEARTRGTR